MSDNYFYSEVSNAQTKYSYCMQSSKCDIFLKHNSLLKDYLEKVIDAQARGRTGRYFFKKSFIQFAKLCKIKLHKPP